MLRKEKKILYFSKGFKLKTVEALKRSFYFSLNLVIEIPLFSEKLYSTKRSSLKDYMEKSR